MHNSIYINTVDDRRGRVTTVPRGLGMGLAQRRLVRPSWAETISFAVVIIDGHPHQPKPDQPSHSEESG